VAAAAATNHHDFLVALDHAAKLQNHETAQVQAAQEAAAAEEPALRVVRPAAEA
jgi:hypothetical protein